MSADGPKTPLYGGKSAHRRVDIALAGLAARQHGVVALFQLAGMGLDSGILDKRVATGRLHRVHQGVYAVGHPLLTREGRFLAAALACGPRAVVSHRSAAAVWGIRQDRRRSIDVTAPGRRGRIPKGIQAHRHGSLHPRDLTVSTDGIPCTSVARTLLDLAGVVGVAELRNAVTEAEVLRLFDLSSLREVIARNRGRRGVARLRRAIAEHEPRDERAREGLERTFLSLCRRAGLPPPEVNVPLFLQGTQFEADFLWRDARLIVETDDRRSHATIVAFEKDRRRDRRLTVAGWRVLRCTWRQVSNEPADLTQSIRALLAHPDP
jgi:predicted transcriptional regulator of viral defense system